MNITSVFRQLSIQVKKYKPISGGDINEAYFIEAEEGDFFIKLNNAKRHPQMLEKEANGLNALNKTQTVIIPEIVEVGEVNGIQFLLLKWIEKGEVDDKIWKDFGSSVAQMHQISQPYFGFEEDNYIGSIKQINAQSNFWEELYGNHHIQPLVKILVEQGKFKKEDIRIADHFCSKIGELFPKEPPSLVHGDLWGGNYLISNKGKAVVIDPAVYYGHREMDIGMTKLFGGFTSRFYEAYHEAYPLEKSWQKRLPYTQLYPILVHAVLFGGHYVEEAKEILSRF